jgi:Ribbon-helix-helix protein, copG family
MSKPTTIRLPDDLLKEIDQLVQELKLDRSAYLREIVSKGFSIDREERLLQKYVKGELNYMEVCRDVGWNPWQLLDHLKARNLHLNVDLEDWLDSAQLNMEKE